MLVECSNCGAPLDVSKRSGVIRCGYCGRSTKLREIRMLSEQTPPQWAPPQVWTPPPQYHGRQVALAYHVHRQSAGARALIIPLVALAIAGVTASVLVTTGRTASHASGASVLAYPGITGRPDAVTRPFRSSCKLDQALATWKREGMPTRPSYSLMLPGIRE